MDFSWTPEQIALRDDARSFASRKLGRDLVERDHRGAVSETDWRDGWEECSKYGLFSLCVPKAYGGRGHDILTTILILEAIGYGCPDNGLTLGINGQIWAVQEPIISFGTEEQKKRFLPGLSGGALVGAHAMTELESGSNPAAMKSQAQPVDGGYVLNGVKTYIGLAPACDIALVFASTSPDRGAWGVTAFLVEADTKGVAKSSPQQKMGLRTAPMGELTFKDVFVPEENRLGREGAGLAIFQHAMEWERSFIFTSHVGSMQRQLDEAIAFSTSRNVFGKEIDQYQSVSNRLAEMKLRLECAQLLLYKAAWLKSQGKSCAMEAALAKLHISEAFAASSMDAIRIHGGRGYLSEHGVERDLRDSIGGVIYSGTSDIQRNIIAELLKK